MYYSAKEYIEALEMASEMNPVDVPVLRRALFLFSIRLSERICWKSQVSSFFSDGACCAGNIVRIASQMYDYLETFDPEKEPWDGAGWKRSCEALRKFYAKLDG